ncbi:MAG TPA: hypothetical protein VL947_12440, partial [Cytophagales bacterium]|nr:hypothetical protein [Cytophagales bacterium]
MSLLVAEIEKQIGTFAEPQIFLIEVIVGGTPKTPKITVVVDSDTGVTIQECTTISRKLNKYLGEVVYTDNNYSLEVTSPGADKPIKVNRQYKKNIGRSFKIVLNSGEELEAELKEVNDEGLVLVYQKVEKVNNKKVKTPVEARVNYS